MSAEWVIFLHAVSTWAMVGLIWFVQVVHYPLYATVHEAAFVSYVVRHNRRTGWVVGPLMLTEVGTALALCRVELGSVSPYMPLAGLGLLLLIWGSTAGLQVPCHRRLERGYDLATIRRLVATNWVRTIGWTARGGLAVWILQVGERG
ncbi:MAG: hypothetical protein AB7O52_15760 [Planctomycetota bacterium]